METGYANETRTGSAEAAWKRLRALLEGQWHSVQAQIRKYPPPIPACDADFNHLLLQRDRISEELRRLDEAASAGASDSARLLTEFLKASHCLDDETKRQVLINPDDTGAPRWK